MLKICYVILDTFLYLFTVIRFHDIWKFKRYLFEHKDKQIPFKQNLIRCYDRRLSKKCCWIGYNSVFKGTPIFPHGIFGLFVSGGGKIGSNCVIYQQVTIGSNTLIDSPYFGSPTIGDNVLIGAGAKIIGKIKVGNNVRIGANAVVVRDVPDNSVVVSTGRIIQKNGVLDNRFFSYSETKGGWGYYKDGIFIIDKSVNIE